MINLIFKGRKRRVRRLITEGPIIAATLSRVSWYDMIPYDTRCDTMQHDTTQYDMIQHDTASTRHDTTRYDTMQHDTTPMRHDKTRYDTNATWYYTIWHDVTRCNTIQHDATWYDTIRHDTTRYDTSTTWYDLWFSSVSPGKCQDRTLNRTWALPSEFIIPAFDAK
jgi:hypothetical protein